MSQQMTVLLAENTQMNSRSPEMSRQTGSLEKQITSLLIESLGKSRSDRRFSWFAPFGFGVPSSIGMGDRADGCYSSGQYPLVL